MLWIPINMKLLMSRWIAAVRVGITELAAMLDERVSMTTDTATVM